LSSTFAHTENAKDLIKLNFSSPQAYYNQPQEDNTDVNTDINTDVNVDTSKQYQNI
jgi:hypothetical protein